MKEANETGGEQASEGAEEREAEERQGGISNISFSK